MTAVDFFIGFFLMNAMPHFVLGVWGGRMLSLYGFGPRANIAYALTNLAASLGLFVATYGWAGLTEHGVYAGGATVLGLYLLTGHLFYRLFHR